MSNADTSQTIDYLMTLNEQGVIVYSEGDVFLNDLTEWLSTPRGSVFGNPSWGNDLNKFKHEVMNEDLAVSVESSLARGILRDLPSLSTVSSVEVSESDFDRYQIKISTPYGTVSRLI